MINLRALSILCCAETHFVAGAEKTDARLVAVVAPFSFRLIQSAGFSGSTITETRAAMKVPLVVGEVVGRGDTLEVRPAVLIPKVTRFGRQVTEII